MCPDCKHTLAAKDLVPLLSWLELRGKCRYCQRSISWHYPAVELATAMVFLLSYLFWPYEWALTGMVQFMLWLAVVTVLIALLLYDLYWMLLPTRLVYIAAVLAIPLVLLTTISGGLTYLLGVLFGSVMLGGGFWLLFQLSDGHWIGGGDVRLGFVLGALAGSLFGALLLLLIASLLGTLIALPHIVRRGLRTHHKLPFGPFLIIATLVVYLFGFDIIAIYKQFAYLATI